MTAPRLPFLWPMLFRPLKCPRPAPRISAPSSHPRRHLNLTASSLNAEPAGHERPRYGTAQEPNAHLLEEQAELKKDKTAAAMSERNTEEPIEEEEDDESSHGATTTTRPTIASTLDQIPTPQPPVPPKGPETQPKPLETVLNMPPPAEQARQKHPHFTPPPYVHHFDTYSLVKQLGRGGYTPEQAVTTMKAVRGILTDNMELAREGLVSKSNVENETYLFRAACSELRTEIENSRKGEIEKMRSERNQLQHELDILNQKMGQETTHLKDELKGLFDDRKMSVRQESRTMESKIQEMNYKITISLNSDARSEVEALRWVLTRRAAIAIGVSAFILFMTLRYSSYLAHAQEAEEKKKAQRRNPPPRHDDDGFSNSNSNNSRNNNSSSNNSSNNNSPSNNSPMSDQDALAGEMVAARGGVSLG